MKYDALCYGRFASKFYISFHVDNISTFMCVLCVYKYICIYTYIYIYIYGV